MKADKGSLMSGMDDRILNRMSVHVTANSANPEGIVDRLQISAFDYFDRHAHGVTGLVRDCSITGSNASIAGSGYAIASYAVAAERGILGRSEAARRTLVALRFLEGKGVNGFFYHFVDCDTGERALRSEVSTIDSAILFAGALAVAEYFDRDEAIERDIRRIATGLYLAANWNWVSPRAPAIGHGWTPERGFLRYDWRGYNEALLLYILALGSPTHPVRSSAYDEWLTSYKWKSLYGQELIYGGPLFVHQVTHAWIDLRGIQDRYVRARGIDYFENSRRATYVQRGYAIRNPRQFAGYGEDCWGFSASTGPSTAQFGGYRARGAPFGPDDGTIAPWTTAASLPFAPEIVLPALSKMEQQFSRTNEHGFGASFNHACSTSADPDAWIADHSFAIDQGPIVLMTENYQTGLIWRLLRRSQFVQRGLERAGFTGGWLENAEDEMAAGDEGPRSRNTEVMSLVDTTTGVTASRNSLYAP